MIGRRSARGLTQMQGPLFRYRRAVLGDATFSEDVLQEVLFTIYRKLDWLRDPALNWRSSARR